MEEIHHCIFQYVLSKGCCMFFFFEKKRAVTCYKVINYNPLQIQISNQLVETIQFSHRTGVF